MHREMANWISKAKIKNQTNWGIYEIFIRIWLCLDLNCLFLEADSEYEFENIDFQNFWTFYLFFLKGALDKYKTDLFISNSKENSKLN